MSTKWKQLIDLLINEESEKANALFHEIVVEQSRVIYENIISEEDDEDEDEKKKKHDQDMEENMSFEDGMETHHELGGDETDDLMHDVGDEEPADDVGMPGMDGEEGDMEDRVMDLEDALDELKAEFEALLGKDGDHDEMGGGEEDGADYGDEMGGGEEDGEEGDDDDMLREYVENVGHDWDKNAGKGPNGQMVGTGAKSEKQGERNTKSIVASPNHISDFGSAKNIATGGRKSESAPDGTSAQKKPSNEYTKGEGQLPGAGKFANSPKNSVASKFYSKKEQAWEKSPEGSEGKMAGANTGEKDKYTPNTRDVLPR
jgi:hypothetical protein